MLLFCQTTIGLCNCQVNADPGSYQRLLVFVFIFFGVTDIFRDFADLTGHSVDFDIEHLGTRNHFYVIKMFRSAFFKLSTGGSAFYMLFGYPPLSK